jgi:hypothetical protein
MYFDLDNLNSLIELNKNNLFRNLLKKIISERNQYIISKTISLSLLNKNQYNFLITEYCKTNNQLKIVVIYPRAFHSVELIEPILQNYGKIMGKTQFNLDKKILKNLVWLFYLKESRMGYYPQKSDFIDEKVRDTFLKNEPLTAYLFLPKKPSKIIKMKEKIRYKCNYGFHSIHINDRYYETVQAVRSLFHVGSLNKYSNKLFNLPDEYLDSFFAFLQQYNSLDLVDQDALRLDKEFFTSGTIKYSVASSFDHEAHSKLNFPYNIIAATNIYNPDLYFYWFGVKCELF